MPLLVLLTDFGLKDGFVGTMKGVIGGIAPEIRIIDLSHDIPPQNLSAAGFVLWNSYKYFPEGTIFVCVVDPGVGSGRRIIGVKVDRYTFIAPENGLLDFILVGEDDWICREVTNIHLFREEISQTFHGRDIFAPVGAHLAAGLDFEQLGPVYSLSSPESLFRDAEGRDSATCRVIHIDHFGNLITNLRFPAGGEGKVVLKERTIPVRHAYAHVKVGETLALTGSHGLLEIAVRNGNAAEVLKAGYGQELQWFVD